VNPIPGLPSFHVQSRDGTRIAVFSGGSGPGTPVLLVHGTGSDHTTWRVVAPLLAAGRPVHAMDRRGRGASIEGDAPYAAAREAEDIAAVSESLADRHGAPIRVVGHSLGGRLALAAAPRTAAIAGIVAYESAPGVRDAAEDEHDERLLVDLQADLARGDRGAVLERFMRDAVQMPDDELAAFRASDLWSTRAATAPQIVRELDAALHDPAIGIGALAGVTVPVLQLTGSATALPFRLGVLTLDRRLANGSVEVIDGARHAAHHSHPAEFVAAVERFLSR